MPRVSTLVFLLLAFVCMLGFTEAWFHRNNAYNAPETVEGENEVDTESADASTEEDAVDVQARLMTRDVYLGPRVCQLIRKVACSAERRGQGSGPWRSVFWSRRRCWGILRFLERIARLLGVSCDLTATTVESQSPTTTPLLAPTTTPEPTTPAPTTTQGGKCLNTPKQRSVHCLCYREYVGQSNVQ